MQTLHTPNPYSNTKWRRSLIAPMQLLFLKLPRSSHKLPPDRVSCSPANIPSFQRKSMHVLGKRLKNACVHVLHQFLVSYLLHRVRHPWNVRVRPVTAIDHADASRFPRILNAFAAYSCVANRSKQNYKAWLDVFVRFSTPPGTRRCFEHVLDSALFLCFSSHVGHRPARTPSRPTSSQVHVHTVS